MGRKFHSAHAPSFRGSASNKECGKAQSVKLSAWLAVLSVLVSAGCSMSPGSLGSRMTESGRLLAEGPPATMTASAIAQNRQDSVPLLYAFALEAGQIRQPSNSNEVFPAVDPDQQQVALLANRIDWPAVTLVGEGYIDAQCGRFLTALDELERSKRGTLANLNAMQSATVGIMGLALAAQQAIGIVGVAFGLASSLIDNSTSVVLYQLPASSIRTIVKAQRDSLRLAERPPSNVLQSVNNQGMAAARLAEYIEFCVPVTIEGNVGKVLNSASSDPKTGDIVTTPTPPAVTSALAPVISAIPTNTPIVRIAPKNPAPLSVLDVPVQQRKVHLVSFVRGVSDPVTLKRVADILKIDMSEAAPIEQQRAQIIVEVNSRVSGQDPDLARQQMDAISQLLSPVFGRAF